MCHMRASRMQGRSGVPATTGKTTCRRKWSNGVRRCLRVIPVCLPEVGTTLMGSPGVFMLGCDPVEPDLVVVRADQGELLLGKHIEGVPGLIVEVLSPSHPELDAVIKYEAYARAGVPEYWMVRPASRDV